MTQVLTPGPPVWSGQTPYWFHVSLPSGRTLLNSRPSPAESRSRLFNIHGIKRGFSVRPTRHGNRSAVVRWYNCSPVAVAAGFLARRKQQAPQIRTVIYISNAASRRISLLCQEVWLEDTFFFLPKSHLVLRNKLIKNISSGSKSVLHIKMKPASARSAHRAPCVRGTISPVRMGITFLLSNTVSQVCDHDE